MGELRLPHSPEGNIRMAITGRRLDVGNTPTLVAIERTKVTIWNGSSVFVDLGGADVVPGQGFLLHPGGGAYDCCGNPAIRVDVTLGRGESLYAVSSSPAVLYVLAQDA